LPQRNKQHIKFKLRNQRPRYLALDNRVFLVKVVWPAATRSHQIVDPRIDFSAPRGSK